jgi:penicillin-binding protein 2
VNVREQREDLARRARVLIVVTYVLLAAVAAGYWSVQVVRGAYYRELAENNRLRAVPIKAPRGLIYDRNGRILVENVPSYDLLLDRSRSAEMASSLRYAAAVLGRRQGDLETLLGRHRAQADFQLVPLAENLALPEVSRFGVESLEHPEFEIGVRHLRFYRHGSQTAHVLGYLGEVNQEDLARAPGVYQPGDLVGRRGVEATYDQQLRGHDGERVLVVDSRGKPLEEYERRPAAPGRSLTLTIDLDLQQEAERLLGDGVGAVVALDPRNGEVLALVSSPSYDPNSFARRLDEAEWRQLVESPNQPLQNRTLQSAFSPGSLFKIVLAVAGLSEGVIHPGDTVYCNGGATFYNRRFRCHKRGGHGRVNLQEAIKASCDVYFYQLGQKLGIERIATYARRFGLGTRTGIDIGGERAGLVPDPAWSLRARGGPWYPGETISVAIGQGPLLATPLQVAVMMAAVANGGRAVTPHLVRDAGADDPGKSLGLDPEALAAVRRGLRAVVNDPDGTGRAARVPGLVVAGKTGTVQVVSQNTWTSNEELPFAQRDHAWFASFAPFDDPRLVVVVFCEHGGRGSAAAAPLAKALYERFFETDQLALRRPD